MTYSNGTEAQFPLIVIFSINSFFDQPVIFRDYIVKKTNRYKIIYVLVRNFSVKQMIYDNRTRKGFFKNNIVFNDNFKLSAPFIFLPTLNIKFLINANEYLIWEYIRTMIRERTYHKQKIFLWFCHPNIYQLLKQSYYINNKKSIVFDTIDFVGMKSTTNYYSHNNFFNVEKKFIGIVDVDSYKPRAYIIKYTKNLKYRLIKLFKCLSQIVDDKAALKGYKRKTYNDKGR